MNSELERQIRYARPTSAHALSPRECSCFAGSSTPGLSASKPKSNRAFYANQRQERNRGEALMLSSQQPEKYQISSPQFPTKKFQNGSFWFTFTFLKHANMPNEYAGFMNLRENSERVQLPHPAASTILRSFCEGGLLRYRVPSKVFALNREVLEATIEAD